MTQGINAHLDTFNERNRINNRSFPFPYVEVIESVMFISRCSKVGVDVKIEPHYRMYITR